MVATCFVLFGALLVSSTLGQTGVESNLTTYMYPDSNLTAESVYKVNGSRQAPKGADILTVGVIGGNLSLVNLFS